MFSFVAILLISFFEDLCFLNPRLKAVRDPGGDDGFGPPHYLSGLYISHYLYGNGFS